jgi:cyclophilin family peptidyl-prolyl cis-trans isomerase
MGPHEMTSPATIKNGEACTPTFNSNTSLLMSETTKTTVVFETTQGKITFKLLPKIAPKACENFVGLIEQGYYDGIIFHRIIPQFMVQCGDPTGTGRGGKSLWGKPFEDEVTPDVRFDKTGLLAMVPEPMAASFS